MLLNFMNAILSSKFAFVFCCYILTCALNDFVLSRYDKYPFLNVERVKYPRYIRALYRRGY